MDKKIISTTAIESIEKYESRYKNDSTIFTQDEITHLSNRTAASRAGFAALKGALKNLLTITENVNVEVKDIELGHAEDGAPIIRKLPGKIDKENYQVSISHSKDCAAGLASGEKA